MNHYETNQDWTALSTVHICVQVHKGDQPLLPMQTGSFVGHGSWLHMAERALGRQGCSHTKPKLVVVHFTLHRKKEGETWHEKPECDRREGRMQHCVAGCCCWWRYMLLGVWPVSLSCGVWLRDRSDRLSDEGGLWMGNRNGPVSFAQIKGSWRLVSNWTWLQNQWSTATAKAENQKIWKSPWSVQANVKTWKFEVPGWKSVCKIWE